MAESKIEEYSLSQEQHMKDYPHGYEIVFNMPTKIEIFWKKRRDIINGELVGEIHPACIEEDEVIEVHLWKEQFYPYSWKIAFEGIGDGRCIDFKNISGWRLKREETRNE